MSNAIWYFIINPVSGNGKGLEVWSEVRKQLEAEEVNFSFGISEYHKHTIQLITDKHKEGVRHFIGIGGDGTLNEIVNGIMDAQVPTQDLSTLALIPVGTGNDWVKSQKVIFTANSLVSKLQEQKTQPHNVGRVNTGEGITHYFMNIAGAGIDGAIVKELEAQNKKGKAGQWVYIKSLIKTLFSYKTTALNIEVDAKPLYAGGAFIVAASIGKYFGSGMLLSPKAEVNSDTLDFTLAKKDKLYRIFPQLHKLFNGKIASATFVEKGIGDKASITTDRLVSVQADGELVGETKRLSFELIPKGIKVLV